MLLSSWSNRLVGRSVKRVIPLLVLGCTIATEPTGHDPRFAELATPPAILLIAGDIARCTSLGDEQTAAVLDSLVGVHPTATVVPLGDLVYPMGTAANFRDCYGPSWGRHKSRSRAVIGNHEYDASPTGQFFWDYMGDRAGPRGKGYYSWDLPSWHIVVLNTNSNFVPTKAGSPQGNWLLADLASHTQPCLLALFHHPRFASPVNTTTLPALPGYTLYPWQRLTASKADLAVNGSFHYYERYAPQLADGTASPDGMRQIIAGTGGASGSPTPGVRRANSQVWANTRGVLKLELGEGFYTWEFVGAVGRDFRDTGTATCHKAPVVVPDTLPTDTLPKETPPDTTPVDTTPPPPPPPAIGLTVKGEKRSDGKAYMTLDWKGASGANVDVFRNGVFLNLQVNDGHYVNSRTYSGPATYRYRVCEIGSGTCSAEVSVTVS
jgi:hypothetical protein